MNIEHISELQDFIGADLKHLFNTYKGQAFNRSLNKILSKVKELKDENEKINKELSILRNKIKNLPYAL